MGRWSANCNCAACNLAKIKAQKTPDTPMVLSKAEQQVMREALLKSVSPQPTKNEPNEQGEGL
jgi:hypothetical protein